MKKTKTAGASAATAPITVGSKYHIMAGTRVNRNGTQTRQLANRSVTITKVEQTKTGKIRIFWVSTGKPASTLV